MRLVKSWLFAMLALLWMAAPAVAADNAIAGKPFSQIKGGTLSMNDLKGKVVLVNFWATWCPPCRDEIPDLNDIQTRYAAKGLQVVGANFMDTVSQDELVRFVDEFAINYPVIHGPRGEMRALAQYLGGLMGLPTTFFVDRQGKVTYIHTGALNAAQLVQIVAPMLGE